jgi:uncharacterized protein YvpB
MGIVWKTIKYAASTALLVGLVFSSGLLSVLIYGRLSGQEWALGKERSAGNQQAVSIPSPPVPTPLPVLKASAKLKAPLVKQLPELRSGCELTSLTMLLQFYGIGKDKMELVPELKRDPTKIRYSMDGKIQFWGNPLTGFVGDITGKTKGFGIYHTGLMELLLKYVPTGIDLTGKSFETVERQVAAGIPVIVWTTTNFQEPETWVEWDSPAGKVRTTFSEHAVLLVGYDEKYVYVNDPLSGQTDLKIAKSTFVGTWKSMGSQALSYTEPK